MSAGRRATERSDSSPSATQMSPSPPAALVPSWRTSPPTTKLGDRPSAVRATASIALVVVLPCAPGDDHPALVARRGCRPAPRSGGGSGGRARGPGRARARRRRRRSTTTSSATPSRCAGIVRRGAGDAERAQRVERRSVGAVAARDGARRGRAARGRSRSCRCRRCRRDASSRRRPGQRQQLVGHVGRRVGSRQLAHRRRQRRPGAARRPAARRPRRAAARRPARRRARPPRRAAKYRGVRRLVVAGRARPGHQDRRRAGRGHLPHRAAGAAHHEVGGVQQLAASSRSTRTPAAGRAAACPRACRAPSHAAPAARPGPPRRRPRPRPCSAGPRRASRRTPRPPARRPRWRTSRGLGARDREEGRVDRPAHDAVAVALQPGDRHRQQHAPCERARPAGSRGPRWPSVSVSADGIRSAAAAATIGPETYPPPPSTASGRTRRRIRPQAAGASAAMPTERASCADIRRSKPATRNVSSG